MDKGIMKPEDLRVLLAAYVQNELFDEDTMPAATNARFFPSKNTLRNMVYK
jgi:hypothetical protein